MAQKENVMKKQGFISEEQYYAFATAVGHRIAFSRQIGLIAKALQVDESQLPQQVSDAMMKWLQGEEASYTSNPLVVLFQYLRLLETDYEDLTPRGKIAAGLRSTTEQSFVRFCDRNKLTAAIRRNYLKPEGEPLDVQAEIIEVEIEEIVQFICDHPNGPATYQPPHKAEIEQTANAFKSLAGFLPSGRFLRMFQEAYQTAKPADTTVVPF